MAEFCIDCFNKMNSTDFSKEKYILSNNLELCEGCGEWKHIVIMEQRGYSIYDVRNIFLPFEIIGYIIYLLLKLLKKAYVFIKKQFNSN